MPPSPTVCHLVATKTGLRVPISASGLLIGRSSECHVVIDDEHVSRRHAQIWLGPKGVELIPLGRNPVLVNGSPHAVAATLADGDQLTIAHRTFRVEIQATHRAPVALAQWTLEHGETWYGLNRAPYTIGGGDDDDLIVRGWATAAVRFHQAQAALFVDVDSDGIWLNDAATVAGSVETVGEGDRLGLGEFELTLRKRTSPAVTPVRAMTTYPERIELDVLPRGGRLTLTFAGLPHTLVVSERRLELLSVLLRPPPPLRPGDFVSDTAIQQRVWPSSDRADQSDLNVLVHRLRRDLVKAGVNGPALITRQAGGGGTRFAVAPTTQIIIVGL